MKKLRIFFIDCILEMGNNRLIMIVCGTGHRRSNLYPKDRFNLYLKLSSLIAPELSRLNPSKVISGMALGFDMVLAYTCYTMKIPYVAAVPFAGQDRLWEKEDRDVYNWLLDNSVENVIVSEGGYNPSKMQIRNKWMVDHSDLVLALCNSDKGGTANCINYAMKMNKPVINLWPKLYESMK